MGYTSYLTYDIKKGEAELDLTKATAMMIISTLEYNDSLKVKKDKDTYKIIIDESIRQSNGTSIVKEFPITKELYENLKWHVDNDITLRFGHCDINFILKDGGYFYENHDNSVAGNIERILKKYDELRDKISNGIKIQSMTFLGEGDYVKYYDDENFVISLQRALLNGEIMLDYMGEDGERWGWLISDKGLKQMEVKIYFNEVVDRKMLDLLTKIA